MIHKAISSRSLRPLVAVHVFLAAAPLVAQPQAAGITSVKPDRVVAGIAQMVEVQGEGLTGASVSLAPLSGGAAPVFQVEPVSQKILRVRLPGDVQPGEYRFCVEFPGFRECRSLEVVAFDASIEVTPKKIFSAQRETIVISGSSGSWARATLEGSARKQTLVLSEAPLGEPEGTFEAHVEPGLLPGPYRLLLFRNDKDDRGLLAANIEVRGPLSPKVERIVPPWIRRHRDGDATITVEGRGLAEIESATLLGYSACARDDTVCWYHDPPTDRRLVFEIAEALGGGSTEDINVLFFADGTEVPLEGFGVVAPIVPWSSPSWIVFVVLLSSCFAVITLLDLDSHKKELTAPGHWELANWLFMALMVLLLVALLLAFFWGAFTEGIKGIDWLFLGFTVVLGLNLALPFGFAWIRSELDPERQGARRPYLVATLAALLALAGPFALDALDLPRWGLPAEAALLGVVLLGGGALSAVTRRRLDRQRAVAAGEQALAAAVDSGMSVNGRVTLQDLPEAPRDRAIKAMSRYWVEHRSGRSLTFSEAEGVLTYQRWHAIQEVARAFRAARSALEGEQELRSTAWELVERLARWLPFVAEPHPAFPKLRDALTVFRATPVLLESVLPSPFPLLVFSEARIDDKQIRRLQAVLKELDAPSRFAVLITLHPGLAVRERIAKSLGGLGRENVVTLDESDCLEVLMGEDEVRGGLMKAIQRQADLSVFSPYRSDGPTTAEMFFGREREVRSVLDALDHSSVSVLGARRIGKTSMVRTVQRLLEERGKLLFYLDCYHIETYEELFQEIANRWQLPGIDSSSWRGPLDFPRLVRELQDRHPGRSLIFLMDEIDRLLTWDAVQQRGEKLFRLLRSLSQERRCQFMFSGERAILDRRESPASAFFNFGMPVQLGLLDRVTSSRLIYDPMSLVGVVLADEQALLSLIYKQTSGHPNLIQFLCERSLEKLSRAGTRTLDVEQVRKIAEEAAYRDRYVQTFWSQATPLEKAISVCLAEEGEGTGGEIRDRLQRAGFLCELADVARGFRYLRLSQLLIAKGDRYALGPRLFAPFLESMYPYAAWKESLLHDWTEAVRTDERAFG